MSLRIEHDSLGPVEVESSALYGASTQRALNIFPVSGISLPRSFIAALGLVKLAAAQANCELGVLSSYKADLIIRVAEEIICGDLDAHFPVDIFQTGSGTSINMNANEVIANRAAILEGKAPGRRCPLHPNDDVNRGQSSNDVIPTAIHIALATELASRLGPELKSLAVALADKASHFSDVVKPGRTHLMDAAPVTLGQVFGGFARQARKASLRAQRAICTLEELPLGGTAVGTGLNTHPSFAAKAIAIIHERTKIPFREAVDHFEAQSAKDDLAEVAGNLKTIAISLYKIANDIRWLASGPRCGLAEIRLPALQPGSSIMPGKVNPVMSECLMQVCADVIGSETTVSFAASQGNFELNTMMPLIAYRLLSSTLHLAKATGLFCRNCVQGIEADVSRCREMVEQSAALATALVPRIGYDRAAEIAKESVTTGRTIREIVLERKMFEPSELDRIFDPAAMAFPDGRQKLTFSPAG